VQRSFLADATAMGATPDPLPPSSGLPQGRLERLLLGLVAGVLALLLVGLRGGLHPAAPLERLARQSPELDTALSDGRPTLVEFYADWCEACRTMAPAMEALERQHRGALDVVLLNVDNPRWQPQLERYAVNGIPQLEFFNASGEAVGRSIGARRPEELQTLTTALLEDQPLPMLAGVGASSDLATAAVAPAEAPISPRSHG
jgi:thiol-disulfide isomerase/thioredoxin